VLRSFTLIDLAGSINFVEWPSVNCTMDQFWSVVQAWGSLIYSTIKKLGRSILA